MKHTTFNKKNILIMPAKSFKTLSLSLLIVFTCLRSVSNGQELGEAERKSLEKGNYPILKNAGLGEKEPGLNLPPEKMKWWLDQKFGMFIHWGLYAIPAAGEWTMFNQKIPAEEYAKLADKFKPRFFNAETWASIAKNAGMKYMVMVSRHHDGFALWDSPASWNNFNSMETAAKRDFVAEYTAACRKAGLKVGLYYSPMDWRFPGYFDPKGLPENAALMKDQCYGQVEELMKNYGKIDILWYDGAWLAHKGGDAGAAWFWEPLKLNKMVRSYQPDIVVNPRSGMYGDFETSEGDAEVSGPIVPVPWEKCLNLNRGSWGYHTRENLMPLKNIITMLVNTVDRGGNMLLNVGPDQDGVIPAAHVARLKEVGDWLDKHGESIYGTRPGPFEPVDGLYGATHKGNKIFIHLIEVRDGKYELTLPPIEKAITSCRMLNGPQLKFKQDKTGVTLILDPKHVDPVVSTIVLEVK